MNIWSKWWFWVLVVIVLVAIYFALVALKVIPTYQCIYGGLGIDGQQVKQCLWHKGSIPHNWNIVY